jgi:hypothetical protein
MVQGAVAGADRQRVGPGDGGRDIVLARRAASGRDAPRPSHAARAEDRVQPVPWVLREGCRGAPIQCAVPDDRRRSGLSGPPRCPPFSRTDPAPSAASASACAAISSTVVASATARRSAASGRFGVTTVARETSMSRSAATASCSRSRSPPLATITGSSTSGTSSPSSAAATVSTMAALPSIPILTASIRMSSRSAAIWSRTIPGSTSSTRRTPRVFWAVRPVIAAIA